MATIKATTMEQPYKGRATIQDFFNELQIIIPAKRHWFVTIFIGAWLCGWLMGELFALALVTTGTPATPFILFWLIAWTFGGFYALRTFIWNINGKEIITVGQNRLKIERRGALLSRPKEYDINEVKNIRVQGDNADFAGIFGIRRSDFGTFNLGGTIRFDYGLKTVKFANGIDEAEAKFILDKMKERRMLTEKNYN